MGKNISLAITGLGIGILTSLILIYFTFSPSPNSPLYYIPFMGKKEIIGFLPYWLLPKANTDYSQYITKLTYFALRIDKDGSLLKLANPTQEESGWYALRSGKVDQFLQKAKEKNIKLSLTIDSGDVHAIDEFLKNPKASADNLVTDVTPIMKKFGFSDLNLDIEYTAPASAEARIHFTDFAKEVRQNLPAATTLTLEISPIDAIQDRLINIKEIAPYADYIVLMSYDYHATDSMVTGPIAPLSGAGVISEYDVEAAVEKTLAQMPAQKLILGLPLYGYEWETIGTIPRSAVIPGSGTIASNRRVETFLAQCSTCSAVLDTAAQEKYLSYFDTGTNTNHIIFFPDKYATSAKISFAKKKELGGVALWALGYEGTTILTPLMTYK